MASAGIISKTTAKTIISSIFYGIVFIILCIVGVMIYANSDSVIKQQENHKREMQIIEQVEAKIIKEDPDFFNQNFRENNYIESVKNHKFYQEILNEKTKN